MKHALPNVEEYEKLLTLGRQLYEHTNRLSWELLLPLFLVSVAISYSTELGITGAIVMRLRRLVLVVLLLVSFPLIAEFCQVLGVEVAKSIDDMTGIDMVLNAASQKADTYSHDIQGLLTMSSDFIMSILVTLSFIILVIARYLLLAFQHFYWLLLITLGPLLILGTLFDSASGITKGLFKNMFQVACWPIIWSILSAFLKALPFATNYSVESGNLVTIITLNLVIAVALLFSPFLASQLCEGVNLSIGSTLKQGALNAVSIVASPKMLAMKAVAPAKEAGRKAFNQVFRGAKK